MNKTERQQQILERALPLFTTLGYKGTTTAAIAKEAGISEVTLFRHFSSKQDIFMKCIEPVFLDTMGSTLVEETSSDPQTTLQELLQERIETISKNHGLVRLVLSESALISDFKEEGLLQIMTQKFLMLFEKIGIPAQHKPFVLRLVMGSILSFLYLPDQDPVTIERTTKSLTHMIFHYMTKENSHE